MEPRAVKQPRRTHTQPESVHRRVAPAWWLCLIHQSVWFGGLAQTGEYAADAPWALTDPMPLPVSETAEFVPPGTATGLKRLRPQLLLPMAPLTPPGPVPCWPLKGRCAKFLGTSPSAAGHELDATKVLGNHPGRGGARRLQPRRKSMRTIHTMAASLTRSMHIPRAPRRAEPPAARSVAARRCKLLAPPISKSPRASTVSTKTTMRADHHGLVMRRQQQLRKVLQFTFCRSGDEVIDEEDMVGNGKGRSEDG